MLGGANSTGIGGLLLPWIVMANIVVTVTAFFFFRVFSVAQWAASQKQLADSVQKLTGQMEDANATAAQLTIKLAVMTEQIKNLEREARA